MLKLLNQSNLLRSTIAFIVAFLAVFVVSDTAAVDKPENLGSFDPAKGFQPAQSDLTEVFLQIAGSLEFYGSPEPYLRHMKAEHERIEAKYRQQMGEKARSFCPPYMDAAYFDRFAANWQHLAPQLGLESLTKSAGHLMRAAINGPDGKGTPLVDVFNEQQHRVYVAMTSKKPMPTPGFDVLKAALMKATRLNESALPVANLTADQQAVVQPTAQIHAAFLKIFAALDAGLSAADAEKVKTAIVGMVDDMGRMAESEIEAASIEMALDDLHSMKPPYSIELETALNADERETFAAFLKKSRFTKADFPALDKFYRGPYDRLSERGKDEMSKRFWEGMRPPR